MIRKCWLIAVLIFAEACACRAALVFSDSFNYTAGVNLGGQGGWSDSTTSGHGEVSVAAGNLSVGGLADSSGNKASFQLGNNNIGNSITVASGTTVYYSFAFDMTSLGSRSPFTTAAGDYFIGIGSSGTTIGGAIWSRQDGTGFDIGISTRSSSTVSWSTTSYSINSPIFLVAEYNVVSGSANDTGALWINPGSADFGATSAPSATLTSGPGSSDIGTINTVLIHSGASDFSSASGGIDFDELRIGTSWADVTPIPEPGAWGAIAGAGSLALCGWRVWRRRHSGES